MLTPLLLSIVFADCEARADDADAAVMAYASSAEKIRDGAIDAGVKTLRELLRSTPTMAPAQWLIASAEESRGNYVAAYVGYKRFLRMRIAADDKTNAQLRLLDLEAKVEALRLYADGERASASQNWTSAVLNSTRAIEQKPGFSLAYRLLAIAQAAQKHAEQAAAAYTTYLVLDEDAPDKGEIEAFLHAYDAAKPHARAGVSSRVELRPERDPSSRQRGFGDAPFHLGAKVSGMLQSGLLRGGSAIAAELGYRPAFWQRRLGVMLEPSLLGLWGNSAQTAAFTLGVGITYHQALGPGLFRAMFGPELGWLSVSSTQVTQDVRDQYWTLGGNAGVGYLLELGPGGLLAELRYHLVTSVIAQKTNLGHGATLSLGYVFFL